VAHCIVTVDYIGPCIDWELLKNRDLKTHGVL
jgi:hypothetical protein